MISSILSFLFIISRFTVTMNDKIKKSEILEMKQQVKDEGLARRRSRRIRRRLQNVFPGDSVTGVIKNVIPEGILVTLTSLGPLNITGMIGTRDLPPQFQIPANLNEKYQKQLLLQDFMIGRQVNCGVEKINPKWNPRMLYNTKLSFESFDDKNVNVNDYDLLSNIDLPDNVVISDSEYDSMRQNDDIDSEDDDDDDDSDYSNLLNDDDDEDDVDDYLSEEELQEAFDELSNGKELITIKKFKAWDEMMGLLEDGLINESGAS